MRPRQGQRGAVYLLMLFAVAALGLGLARFGTVWATSAQREREAELIFVGGEFARAIASFRAAGPAGSREGPQTIDDLLLDPRVPFVRRHLRKRYRDPMSGEADWLLELQSGRIVGVRSRSTRVALRSAGLPGWVASGAAVPGEARYSDWLFRPDEARAAMPAASEPR
jgi:hypothetical protein